VSLQQRRRCPFRPGPHRPGIRGFGGHPGAQVGVGDWLCRHAGAVSRQETDVAGVRMDTMPCQGAAKAWAAEQQRQSSDLPLRVTLLFTTAPVTDASRRGGSDFALPLRDRAGAA
jgi:hypothetical protein